MFTDAQWETTITVIAVVALFVEYAFQMWIKPAMAQFGYKNLPETIQRPVLASLIFVVSLVIVFAGDMNAVTPYIDQFGPLAGTIATAVGVTVGSGALHDSKNVLSKLFSIKEAFNSILTVDENGAVRGVLKPVNLG